MEKVTSAHRPSTADSNYPERTGSVRKRSQLFSMFGFVVSVQTL